MLGPESFGIILRKSNGLIWYMLYATTLQCAHRAAGESHRTRHIIYMEDAVTCIQVGLTGVGVLPQTPPSNKRQGPAQTPINCIINPVHAPCACMFPFLCHPHTHSHPLIHSLTDPVHRSHLRRPLALQNLQKRQCQYQCQCH